MKMSTTFMNSESSSTSDVHRLRLNLTDNIDLLRGDNRVALSNLSIYYTWNNIKKLYRNNKFKISGTTGDEEFELLDGSFSIPDIQGYFEYIIKKHETLTDKSPVEIYVNRIQNRVLLGL